MYRDNGSKKMDQLSAEVRAAIERRDEEKRRQMALEKQRRERQQKLISQIAVRDLPDWDLFERGELELIIGAAFSSHECRDMILKVRNGTAVPKAPEGGTPDKGGDPSVH